MVQKANLLDLKYVQLYLIISLISKNFEISQNKIQSMF